MTEESRPPAQDAPAATKATARAPSVGRRVGLAVYLLSLAYIIVVAFTSVTLQVFAPPTTEGLAATRSMSCSDGIAQLARALRVHATAHVEGNDHAPDGAFFAAWDTTFDALAPRCESREFQSLARLRHHIEITLRRFDREEGAAFARLDRGRETPPRVDP